MRLFTASAIIAAVSLGTPAFVQAQGAPSQSEAQKPPAQSSTVIRSVQVVDVKDLKPEVRSKVDEIVAQASEEDIQSLRKSVDATPEAASALKPRARSPPQSLVAGSPAASRPFFPKPPGLTLPPPPPPTPFSAPPPH